MLHLTNSFRRSVLPCLLAATVAPFPAANAAQSRRTPPPTHANVAYGSADRQVLDFWSPGTRQPTPVVFYVYGGGWTRGEKTSVSNVARYLRAGLAVVAIDYRYVQDAYRAGVQPPVEWPMHDAARALQFVRSKAAEWNIDPRRIGATGGSAGACTSLWLAFHDDMADPHSSDPVSRQSTRLACAAVFIAQTSLDPKQMKEWTPNSNYGAHAFGVHGAAQNDRWWGDFAAFLARRDELLPWINEYSPYALVTGDDPPVWLGYRTPPALGQPQKDPTHTSNFGVKLCEKLHAVGVPCELVYPGVRNVRHPDMAAYLIDKLTAPPKSA